MRNNGKKLVRLLVAALLALAMALPLTACQVEIPGMGTININDGASDGDTAKTNGGEPGAYDDSLDLLRQLLDERQQDERLAVAYIGDIDGSLSDLAIPLRDWINDTAPGLCAQYTFVRNIPQERVVGDSGSLFCVVPRDPNATVAVNRARWNEAKGGYETLDVLYRSESGDPILLYACADMGESPYPDTEVIVTDSTGKTVTWYPIYGITALPYDYEYDLPLGYSFTVCDEDYGGDMIEESMWTAHTAEQLARYVWTWQGDLAEQPAMATMSLTQGSGAEPGQITFTWWYTKDYGDPQEIYEGSWSLTDSGEHIDLTMTRSGGRQYTKGEAPTTVSGMFPVQVPAAFDVFPVLNVTGGGGAYGFPIQQIPNELLMFEPAQG